MSESIQNNHLFREALHLQEMEENPLDAADIAMFEMFEREGWSADERRAYIIEQPKAGVLVPAAE